MLKDQLIDFMKSFEREHDEFQLYVTFEHVLLHAKDFKAVTYSEASGIRDLLEYLGRAGWEKIEQDGQLIGCKKDKETVMLGVGGQVQWKYGPFLDMADLDQAYLGFIEALFEELRRRGMTLLATGHQPVSTREDIEVVPTEENKCLVAYAENNEKLLDTLLCSARTSISMQYAHVDNFEKRYQAAMIIQPALAALFDNVAWVGGKENEAVMYNLTGICSAEPAFYHVEDAMSEHFKYVDFADFLLDAPAIAEKVDGKLVPAGAKKVEEVFADGIEQEDILRTLRYVKPMVSFDENGMTLTNVDSVPYPLNMAYVLMIKSLMYNPDHITALQQLIEEMKEENLVMAHQEILRNGLKAPMREGTAFDLIKDLFFMITLTTGPKEQHYLQPLNALLFKDVTTKGVSAKQFANMMANA